MEISGAWYSDIIKKIPKIYKTNGVGGACFALLEMQYFYNGSANGSNVIGAFHYHIRADLIDAGIPLMHIDRIMPKQRSRDEFRVWIKEFEDKYINKSSQQSLDS